MRGQGRRSSDNLEDRRGISRKQVAVGDDRIMKQTQAYIVPDAFTHGTSEQRVWWFYQGDTFSASQL